jgi:hypothetical protein
MRVSHLGVGCLLLEAVHVVIPGHAKNENEQMILAKK